MPDKTAIAAMPHAMWFTTGAISYARSRLIARPLSAQDHARYHVRPSSIERAGHHAHHSVFSNFN